MSYERTVARKLAEQYGPFFEAGVWFVYLCSNFENPRYCQVDGLLDLEHLVICEIKLRHTADAYFQLTNLYLPVVQAAYPRKSPALCEITRWFDPREAFPVLPKLVPDLGLAQPGAFSVHLRR